MSHVSRLTSHSSCLVSGSIAYDILLHYHGSFAEAFSGPDLEKLSVSFFCPGLERHHGGTAANIAWNMALLGEKPTVLGGVGLDAMEYIERMKARGIDTSLICIDQKLVTANATIATDSGARQVAFFHPGAQSTATIPAVTGAQFRYGLVGARDPGQMMDTVDLFVTQKIPFIFDPGQLVLGLSADDLKKGMQASLITIMNDHEWEMFSGKTGLSITEAGQLCSHIIVTHGEQGLSSYSQQGEDKVPACTIKEFIDPTGAGDALRAGILVALLRGESLGDGLRLGSALASMVVEYAGTQLDVLNEAELERRMQRTYA